MANTTEATFEANIEAHLTSHGWSALAPKTYDRDLGLFPDELIAYVQASQPQAWDKLVKHHGGESNAKYKFVAAAAKAIDHQGTSAALRGWIKDTGVKVRLCSFNPAHSLSPELTHAYESNRTAVVRQLHHSESNTHDSLDLVLVVNGIPVATAELKNQFTGQGVEHAMAQYRADRNPHDKIFAQRTLVHFAVDPHQVTMTTRLAGDATRFLPFNQGSAGPGRSGTAGNPPSPGYQTAYLWEDVWQRDAWLQMLETFIHVEGGRVLFPRFHQWHAVRSLLTATRADGVGVDRLIQHSAGSGKSNTIAWTAHSLSRLHGEDDKPIFDKVVVITDRKVLDKQLQDTVAGLDHTPGTIVRIDQKSSQLKDALQGSAARVIITTLQKFPVVADLAAEEAAKGGAQGVAGKHFAVIVDEAHSSTSGDSMSKLKQVLGSSQDALAEAEAAEAAAEAEADEQGILLTSAQSHGKQSNLSYFAFTATPKPKTLEIFGQLNSEGVKVPFHTYSMRQAIDEGFIHDVLTNYTTYDVFYKLSTSRPDKDPEVDAAKAKVEMAQFASLHPHMMEAKAKIIVEHFRDKTAHKINGQAKAMVVTRSRLHAIKTKQAIDAYIAAQGYDNGPHPLRTLVAFSGTVTDEDNDVTYTEAGINGFPESQLPKEFHDNYQVLVVAEKYQTGFSEALLHTMYVDKKLGGVKAVQTLSRLNRTTPGKDDTFVLDFANSAEEIQESFAPFYETTLAQPTDPNVLHTMEIDIKSAPVFAHEEMMAAVTALLSGDPAQQPVIYTNVAPAVGRYLNLDEVEQDCYRSKVAQFCRMYSFMSQVIQWHDPELELLFLFGKLFLADLPKSTQDPMPQISKLVQLTHLALRQNSSGAITLKATEEPGVALPGQGKGSSSEPLMDRLSALVAAMNEKFGISLDSSDIKWIDQQWNTVLGDVELATVAKHNDRSQFDLVLEEKVDDLVLDRHAKNGELFNQFFGNPEFKKMLLSHLSSTYNEFRKQSA
ncbi:type I restriction endonuclease subunit R [Janibacter indicus]|uniref:Type I restriction enzyme, R subunit n=1 Tax=Janibacter indicus TaxID=857417 RepID=A0A1W2A824_9MICO|nr:type I restriction endonuclease [Janibacter indicus]SMC56865.1 type I restriction enzyme, R subunit [Janibacter indicus]